MCIDIDSIHKSFYMSDTCKIIKKKQLLLHEKAY